MSGMMQDVEQDFSGGDNQQQGGQDQQTGDMQSMTNTATGGETQGGGFMKDAEKVGEDGMIDQQVNNFMNKEGVPSGADGMVDNMVNKEAQNL